MTSLMIAAGTTLRCLPLVVPDLSDSVFTLLCHVCAILNGVAGIVVCSAPPAIAAAWFPPRERVTATSIGKTEMMMASEFFHIKDPFFQF